MLHGYANPLKRLDTSESVNFHKCLILLDSCRIHATRWRGWDRETRQPGRHGGVIGRTALSVFYMLAFDFQNFRTGRLDPSLDAIAEKASCCRRAVVDALARLRDLGLLTWQRRCEETRDAEGRFRLRQRTNAYAVLPASQWRGYRDTDPPPPNPATLGAPERVPDLI